MNLYELEQECGGDETSKTIVYMGKMDSEKCFQPGD